MDMFKQGMKGPSRPAPNVPFTGVTRYSPVTNWNDDPFGADVFEPNPQFLQKKKPPPRPPPPKVNSKPSDLPLKPSHFVRRPTVLSSLLSRNKNRTNNQSINALSHTTDPEFHSDVDAHKIFPKCEPKNVQTGTLIDLSSPPSSPTFTTRSSSDGLSVDSFGSDATTSTNHHNVMSGGNASQAESGFEDDFDLFLNTRKAIPKDDTLDDFNAVDPFSPQPMPVIKPPIKKKPIINRDLFENTSSHVSIPAMKGPTIIRAKPARPKPPENSALLKNTFGSTFPTSSMSVNTTTPIQKVCNNYGDSFEKPFSWDEESSPERETSPPMPSIPPPPPPEDVPDVWADNEDIAHDDEGPYGVALFDYYTEHPDDLCFSANARIKLIRRVDKEWLYGRLRNGMEGVFPANYIEVKIALPGEPLAPAARIGTAVALYDFEPVQQGDLCFATGDTITVISQISDEWYFGECHGAKGQFPVNYVQMS